MVAIYWEKKGPLCRPLYLCSVSLWCLRHDAHVQFDKVPDHCLLIYRYASHWFSVVLIFFFFFFFFCILFRYWLSVIYFESDSYILITSFLLTPLLISLHIVFPPSVRVCCSFYNWATSWENLLMPYATKKGADQAVHPRSLISAFIVGCLDNIIPQVSISEITSLYLASVAAQACLSLPWSQTRRQVFSWRGSIVFICPYCMWSPCVQLTPFSEFITM